MRGVLRPQELVLLPLWKYCAFELPIAEPGKERVGYEMVVQRLTDETVGYNASAGLGGRAFACGTAADSLVFTI